MKPAHVLCWCQWDRDGKIISRRYSDAITEPSATEPIASPGPKTRRGVAKDHPTLL
jgi:hypothetical protein